VAQPAPEPTPSSPASEPTPGPAATPAPAAPAAATPALAAKLDEEQDPFTFADFTWQTGNARTKDSLLGNQYFTGEFRLDEVFHYSLNRPKDDTIGGSTEAWRHGENQVTQLGIGGDFHVDGVIGRLMTQFGQLATTTPRNDASTGRGQWQLADAYRYLSEAYGGYHIGDPHRGVNNWTYQPSYVSSNTPWFFNGFRLQWFPTDRLKIEPWLINGWQSYARFNKWPGFGGQIRWQPNADTILIFNQYALGTDAVGDPDRHRYHTDDSIQYKWYMPKQFVTFRAEFTYRHASVPYFSGPGGITPPGGNQGAPGSQITDAAGNVTWRPDLVQDEPRFTLALLVKL
jgi:hypothetical protein